MVKMILYAFLPGEVCDQIVQIASVASKTFSRFLSGQCTEAVILGTLFFLVMTLFGFPYALLCGVFIGFTALVPIFGSFLGCAVGAFLILMVDPERTIWFIIMFLVCSRLRDSSFTHKSSATQSDCRPSGYWLRCRLAEVSLEYRGCCFSFRCRRYCTRCCGKWFTSGWERSSWTRMSCSKLRRGKKTR